VSLQRIRRGDVVIVISGAHAGKQGKVLQLAPSAGRVLVEGVNMVKKHLRRTQDNQQGGIVEKEAYLPLSKVMPYCPECKKGVKVKPVSRGDNAVRQCKKCGHVFEG